MLSAAAREPHTLIWAARLAVAGPLLCITLVALLHVLEPEVNDSDAVSEYALGDYGWLMNVACFSAAAGIGALAFVLHRSLSRSRAAVVGIVLLLLAAVAWVFLGAGNIDPEGADATTHGVIHGIGFLLGLPTRLAAPLVLAAAFRRDDRWANHRGFRPRTWNCSVGGRGRGLLGSCARGDAAARARALARLDRAHGRARSDLAAAGLDGWAAETASGPGWDRTNDLPIKVPCSAN